MWSWMVLLAVHAWGSAAAPAARDLCAGEPIPAGTVVTAWHTTNACGTSANSVNTANTMTRGARGHAGDLLKSTAAPRC
jgi:hypothetical protein